MNIENKKPNFPQKLFQVIGKENKKGFKQIALFSVIMAFLDVLSVVLIMPFIGLAMNSDMVEKNKIFKILYLSLEFQNKTDFQVFVGFFVGGVIFLSILFKTFSEWKIFNFKARLENDLSKKIYKAILNQDYEWFFQWKTSDLNKLINNEVSTFINGFISPLMNFFAKASISLALILLLIYIDYKIALVSILILISFYLIAFSYTRKKLYSIDVIKKKLAKNKNRLTIDSIAGIRDLKISRIEYKFVSRFNIISDDLSEIKISSNLIKVIPKNIIEIFAFIGLIGFIIFLLKNGSGIENSIPMIALYAMASYKLIPALQGAYNNFSKIKVGQAALDGLHRNFLKISINEAERFVKNNGNKKININNSIEFSCVDYKYIGAKNKLFENLNFKIPAKKTIGIIGRSGSGKTTIIDIISGLLKTQAGKVLLDGEPLENNLDAWVDQIGYVPQTINLISGTVAENIAFSSRDETIDWKKIVDCSKMANVHEFIMNNLPKGYNTIIGESGVRLSGGLKQRIGIARAIYKNPSVLIFDEATSALDNVTEKEVVDAISKLSLNMTIIIIAHRVTTLKGCDLIMVLDNGVFVDSGTYSELELRNELFIKN